MTLSERLVAIGFEIIPTITGYVDEMFDAPALVLQPSGMWLQSEPGLCRVHMIAFESTGPEPDTMMLTRIIDRGIKLRKSSLVRNHRLYERQTLTSVDVSEDWYDHELANPRRKNKDVGVTCATFGRYGVVIWL